MELHKEYNRARKYNSQHNFKHIGTLWIVVGINDGSDPLILDYSNGSSTVDIPLFTLEIMLTLGWNLISIPLVV
mgnify:CR=1 FL=1